MSTTTPAPGGGDFFDDDNNKAMYLVLPAMILIYGSCCLIYCVHKCRRYCITKSKKKKKMEHRRLIGKTNRAFDNPALTTIDERPGMSSHPPVILTLENLENEHPQAKGGTSRRNQETDVDSLDDVLQAETISGVAPGYADASLSQEMQHLDNQLKAAFRLTGPEANKSNVQAIEPPQQATHEAITAYMNWKTLQKTHPPKLEVKYTATGDTVVVRIPKEKRLKMVQENTAVVHPQEEDINAMLAMREKLNKGILKSMPDIMKKPDENVITLKKISSDSKQRIFLSSQ